MVKNEGKVVEQWSAMESVMDCKVMSPGKVLF